MISQEANRALSAIADAVERRWPEYALYCRFRERGLRSEAFQHLREFTDAICAAPFPDRCEFVEWVCDGFIKHESSGAGLLPDPLLRQVILPTLGEWRNDSPNRAEPYRWLGVLLSATGYQGMRSGLHAPTSESQSFLTRAIEIDSEDQIARVRLIECKIGVLDFNAHHLPEKYLGDPEADLKLAKDSEVLCSAIHQDSEKDRLLQEVRMSQQLIRDWIDAQDSGVDFRTWCRQHQRDYNWPITRIYVRDPEEAK